MGGLILVSVGPGSHHIRCVTVGWLEIRAVVALDIMLSCSHDIMHSCSNGIVIPQPNRALPCTCKQHQEQQQHHQQTTGATGASQLLFGSRQQTFPIPRFQNGRPWSDAGSCGRGCDVGITPYDRLRSSSGTQRVAAGLLRLQEEAEDGAWRCARKCVLHHFLWGALRAVWWALCVGKPD